MAWTFMPWDKGKKEFLEQTLRENLSADQQVLDYKIIGGQAWVAVKNEDGRIHILLLLMKKSGGEYGYKAISEDCGPYYYNCPASLLQLCTPPSTDTANEWRKKVAEKQAEKKTRPKPKPGMIIKLHGWHYMLMHPRQTGRGWIVKRSDGTLYRLTSWAGVEFCGYADGVIDSEAPVY